MDNLIEQFNDPEAEASFDPADVQQRKAVAVLGYIFPILFFLPALVQKDSTFCKFHSNQQFTWFIVCMVLSLVTGIFNLIPVLGAIISLVAGLAEIAAAIVLAVAASRGKAVRIPFIGGLISIF